MSKIKKSNMKSQMSMLMSDQISICCEHLIPHKISNVYQMCIFQIFYKCFTNVLQMFYKCFTNLFKMSNYVKCQIILNGQCQISEGKCQKSRVKSVDLWRSG